MVALRSVTSASSMTYREPAHDLEFEPPAAGNAPCVRQPHVEPRGPRSAYGGRALCRHAGLPLEPHQRVADSAVEETPRRLGQCGARQRRAGGMIQ